MNDDLHTLSYFSRNSIVERGGTLGSEIGRILLAARKHNERNGVTGALLFSGGCFAQVLEGPAAKIEDIFERIQCDPRHRDVTILQFKPIAERSFADWSMAFADASGNPLPESLDEGGFLDSPDRIATGEAARDLIAVLRSLIGRHEEARE